ncbi:prolyl 4-hydroxylase alpha subunit [Cryptosporidium ryanae]|uniref:prolyl 4-hydroxylase alpha subunit n=1 Tax=Cryptosporidium ryanae TaxID=515981 RepID=UPI003519FB7D|nr:prolyl 4-hydroxylase alpha subunit [Cryptosporidium ryanae]
MSENLSNINDEVKTVIKGVTPPEPKVVNTYINMVPISNTDLSQNLTHSDKSTLNQSVDQNKSVPTSHFPVSAMNLEQIQQFMAKMGIVDSKDQVNGLGAAGFGATGLGATGLGAAGFGATGFGATGFGATGFGATGFGATGFGATGFGATGLGATGFAAAGLGETGTDATMKSSENNLIPPVGTLDPNILASLGLNVQKPTLQPIKFPNMQAGVPNLCGIQGQDLNLAAWMQKQKIALALSQMQQNQNKQLSSDSTKGENNLVEGLNNKDEKQNMENSTKGDNPISDTVSAPSKTQSQLTPQLAAFLGNPNLVPTTGVAAGGLQMPEAMPGFGQIGGGFGTSPGTLGGIGAMGGDANAKLLQSITSNMMQQSITGDMTGMDAMIKQYQEKFVNNQLSAAAQLLRQHGIQATIDSNYNGTGSLSTNKKPSILQRIVASKINPNIFIVPNALTFEECDSIIDLVKDRLETSKVSIFKRNSVNDDQESTTEEDLDSGFCKSTTACIKPEETNLIKEVENRLGLLVDSNTQYMEPILVHKYSVNDYIKEHHDGDSRTHTIAVFLSDVDNGGELDFPYAGIRIKPKKGFAVVWPNIDPQNKLDYTTVHAVNKIEDPNKDENNKETESKISSYLLYLHINKEPIRLQYEASLAARQVIQTKTNDDGGKATTNPKTINQVSYTTSTEPDKKT